MTDTVGAMYVKVLSDTSGLRDELTRKFGAEGDKAGVQFGDEFNASMRQKLGQGQAFRTLRLRIDAFAKDAAQRVSNGLSDELDIDWSSIISADEIMDLSRSLKIPVEQLSGFIQSELPKAYNAALDEQVRANKRLLKAQEAAAKGSEDNIRNLNRAIREENTATLNASLDDLERLIRSTYKGVKKENDAFFKNWRLTWRAALFDIDLFGKKIKDVQNRLRRAGTGGWFDTLTNVLGGMIGLSFRLGKVLPDALGGIFSGFQKLGALLSSQNGIIGKFGKGLESVASTLGSFVKGPQGVLVAVVGALAVMGQLIGAAVAVVNALAAGFVALGSAILYTVANLALLVPVLGALGVGFGALVIGALDAGQAVGKLWTAVNETDPKKKAEAWKAYNRELEKLGPNAREAVQEMKPLVKQFSGLKKVAGEALFEGMAAALKKATPLIESVKGGIEEVARAVGDVIEQFLALAQSTTFMESFNTMWATSAVIIRDIGSVAVNLFEGFTNFFAIISPLVEQFTGSLAKASEEFVKWTETEGGRQAILDFFTKAYEIGSLVWQVVKELGLALFDLFTSDAATEAGADLFNWLLEKAQAFRKWINDAAEDGRLKKWFEDAKFVAKGLWSIIEDIGFLFKQFSSEEYRIGFIVILALIKSIMFNFKLLAIAGRLGFGIVLTAVKLVKAGFDNLKKAIQAVIDLLKKIKFPSVPSLFKGILGRSGGGSRAAVLAFPSPMSVGVPGGTGTVTNYWNITTPAADGRVVASQVMNRMAAMAG